MPSRQRTYIWSGIDANGQERTDLIMSDSRLQALMSLYNIGISVTRIRRQRTPVFTLNATRITTTDIVIFSRQIANLLRAGIPVADAIALIESYTENSRLRELLATLKTHVAEGATLHEGLAKFPRQFDSLYVNLVAAGEQSGTLDLMLERIADYQEKRQSLNSRIRKALTYPLTVLIIAGALTALVLVKVVPQFASTFADFGAELPAFTRMVLALADATARYGGAALLVVSTLALTLSAYLRCSETRMMMVDRLLLALPGVGTLLRDACLARLCSTLATTLKAGIPVVEALQATGGAAGNRVFNRACITIARQLGDGQGLTDAIRSTGLFPVMIVQLIHVGENSGTLEPMLEKCANNLEQGVDTLVDSLTSLLEPLIMALLGTIIGGLMLAMYLPVFRLGAVL
jgi:type IV pilus assembly protein PilC